MEEINRVLSSDVSFVAMVSVVALVVCLIVFVLAYMLKTRIVVQQGINPNVLKEKDKLIAKLHEDVSFYKTRCGALVENHQDLYTKYNKVCRDSVELKDLKIEMAKLSRENQAYFYTQNNYNGVKPGGRK